MTKAETIESLGRIRPELLSLAEGKLPRHVAMIMDGNGRWAKLRGLPRSAGHYEGVKSVRRMTELSSDLGIEYLTLYAFSTENWHRPVEEVEILMHLIGLAIEQELPDLIRNNVKIRLAGDLDRVPEEALSRLRKAEHETDVCTGLTLIICISYSSRWEIAEAARRLAGEVAKGSLRPEDISEESFAAHLSTAGIPDPDLLIRTGGDYRISNFLLWQIAYAELKFTDTLWPDFDKEEYAGILLEYTRRERRFGKTSEQLSPSPEI
ncbi:MAG: isoprenyl transferase [Bacteroidales bacterium]|nr:isoprenyl transferase [Bacteroidales bacterium]